MFRLILMSSVMMTFSIMTCEFRFLLNITPDSESLQWRQTIEQILLCNVRLLSVNNVSKLLRSQKGIGDGITVALSVSQVDSSRHVFVCWHFKWIIIRFEEFENVRQTRHWWSQNKQIIKCHRADEGKTKINENFIARNLNISLKRRRSMLNMKTWIIYRNAYRA